MLKTMTNLVDSEKARRRISAKRMVICAIQERSTASVSSSSTLIANSSSFMKRAEVSSDVSDAAVVNVASSEQVVTVRGSTQQYDDALDFL